MVTIPADVAKQVAAYLRSMGTAPGGNLRQWADALDPQPPTLREQAYDALRKQYPDAFAPMLLACADAALAVVADWLAAQPVYSELSALGQRETDVAWIRSGGAS